MTREKTPALTTAAILAHLRMLPIEAVGRS
jgi:hypothetical protein